MTTLATSTPITPTSRPVVPTRAAGTLLTLGSLAWIAVLPFTADSSDHGVVGVIGALAALAFQAGVVWLLATQYRTAAMGDGRVARGFHRLQFVLMGGAMGSTGLDGLGVLHGTPVWAAFDACWPLSMLGMLGIGIRIAIAGRWTGILRWWTLGAQSWFALVPVAMTGGAIAMVLPSVHVVLGYAVLGVLLARVGGLVRRHDGSVVSAR
ncbi:hypothetical protein [Williamsia serinedens]|uniref:DUF2306 domain-containing protein n=1 Tax=Williamsia serinedens TaxID=391736 RepID=A0ABT1GZQ0_9NOCA|nr:hypothetical protein [Williamsia serinedens]MCP2160472.1 hypothetical protein [Williamsia serinedens]